MIRVNVSTDIYRLQRAFSNLTKQQLAKATSQAINQTLLLGRTEARKAVKAVYNIPQKNLNGININRAKPSKLEGSIFASRKPIPMDAFNPKYNFTSSAGATSVLSVSRKGAATSRQLKRSRASAGVTIEVVKGKREVVPYAFLIPGAKPRVFARGEYKSGNGEYGFMRRNKRKNNDSGNDSVKPLISVTVFGAVINPLVKNKIATKLREKYAENMLKALRRQAGTL